MFLSLSTQSNLYQKTDDMRNENDRHAVIRLTDLTIYRVSSDEKNLDG